MSDKKLSTGLDYENFSVEEFASDPDFIQWVRSPQEPFDTFWTQWLENHPHKQAEVDEARQLVRMVHGIRPAAEGMARQEAVWDRIKSTNAGLRSLPEEKAEIPSSGEIPSAPVWFSWWKVAAASLGTMLVVALLLTVFYEDTTMYHTAFGETQQLTLPDGSTVVLNANSSLRLGDKWETTREVWLKGEAFFEVVKKEDAEGTRLQFTVHTPSLDVNVLGTAFTVSERRHAKVILTSGSVSLTLRDEARTIRMQPGDLVEVKEGKKEFIRKQVNPEQFSAWKDHEWILDGLSLEQVSERITETFGIPVEVSHLPDQGQQVTGVVPTNDLEILLKALSTAFGRDFVKKEDRIVVE